MMPDPEQFKFIFFFFFSFFCRGSLDQSKVEKVFPCSWRSNLTLRTATCRFSFIWFLDSVLVMLTPENPPSELAFEIGRDRIFRDPAAMWEWWAFIGNALVRGLFLRARNLEQVWSKTRATVWTADFRFQHKSTTVRSSFHYIYGAFRASFRFWVYSV